MNRRRNTKKLCQKKHSSRPCFATFSLNHSFATFSTLFGNCRTSIFQPSNPSFSTLSLLIPTFSPLFSSPPTLLQPSHPSSTSVFSPLFSSPSPLYAILSPLFFNLLSPFCNTSTVDYCFTTILILFCQIFTNLSQFTLFQNHRNPVLQPLNTYFATITPFFVPPPPP